MDKKKKDRLAAEGWRTGTAADFLGLTPEEAEFVELKLALSSELKDFRSEHGISQVELAERLGSSQSRVAKMEASDPTVSVDLLIRGLFAAGATKKDIAGAISKAARSPARRNARKRSKRRSSSTSDM
jgi:predicted XRE-type DNA-binding protein